MSGAKILVVDDEPGILEMLFRILFGERPNEHWKKVEGEKFPKDTVTVCFIPEKKIMIFEDKQKLWEHYL